MKKQYILLFIALILGTGFFSGRLNAQGFTGAYDPVNWVTSAPVGGSVNTAGAPASIAITGPNSGSGGNFDYSYTFTTCATVNFNWSVSHPDCSYDVIYYGVNGVYTFLTNCNGSGSVGPLNLVNGDVLTFRIYSVDGVFGSPTLTVSNFNAPVFTQPNDGCAGATVITPGTINGNTSSCASADVAPACGSAADGTGSGLWYAYTPGCSGSVTASLCTGTAFNTQLRVYSGTCGALVCEAGNDDFCGTQSSVTWTGTPGVTYYILVHGNGASAGPFSLALSQVDVTAPVADMASLPDVSNDCVVSVTTFPTATDNCAGAITGTTSDPLEYTTPGTHVVTWTYNDGNGNSAQQTQNYIVNPDNIPPVITCTNDTILSNDGGACGAIVTYDMPSATDNCTQPYPGTDRYYIRSNTVGEPWGSSNNSTAMNAVFGVGNWISQYFETCTPGTVFSTATKFVFLEGSDGHANELNNFLQANLTAIENYVDNGGTIFINAAPNEGGNINFGFGGTTLTYPGPFCGAVTAVNPAHPIFNGPFLPAGTSYTGGSFSHAGIIGSGLTDLITGCSAFQFSYKTWGDGLAAFGGMTMPQFHGPLPNAYNLRQNIIDWVANTSTIGGPTITQTSGLPPGSLFPTGTTTNTFTADDGNGNTATCSFTVTVNDTEAPVPDLPASFVTSGPISVYCPDVTTTLDSILVSGLPTVLNTGDINSVCIDITHTWVSDITVRLISPQGTSFILADANGGSGDNYSITCFDMSAATSINFGTPPFNGSFIPEGVGGFDVFNGEDPNGYWKLSIYDAFFGDQAIINEYSIQFGFTDLLPVEAVCSVTLTPPTATDNCDGTITATTSDPVTYTADGTYNVTWTYTDIAGNSSSQTQTIIVDDVTPPSPDVASLPPMVDTCSVLITTLPTATDSCEGAITATTTDPISYNTAGTYTITWTYDDGRGNTSTQTQTVTVIDDEPPIPDQFILPNVVGNCIVSIETPPTATDNCGGLIVGTTTDPTTYNLIGTFFIIWHFDDGNGNTWTQNQTVVVNPCLGLEDESGASDVLIYPNPGSGIFTLSLSDAPIENTEIRLVDALGQVLYAGILKDQVTQFDFSELASATYYLLLTNNNGHISKPVIIRKNY